MDKHAPDEDKILSDPLTAAHITIKPNDMKRVLLGVYSPEDPKPQFTMRYYPHEAPHVTSYHDTELPQDGVYLFFRHFQNFGDKPCTVTIRRVEPDLRLDRA